MTTSAGKKIKERPRDLRQRLTRVTESRTKLKAKNTAKGAVIKQNSDRIQKLTENRDHWKNEHKRLTKEFKKSQSDSEAEINALKAERSQLQEAVESFKKKRTQTD